MHDWLDFMQKGQTINRAYYASELRQLKDASKAKRHGKSAAAGQSAPVYHHKY